MDKKHSQSGYELILFLKIYRRLGQSHIEYQIFHCNFMKLYLYLYLWACKDTPSGNVHTHILYTHTHARTHTHTLNLIIKTLNSVTTMTNIFKNLCYFCNFSINQLFYATFFVLMVLRVQQRIYSIRYKSYCLSECLSIKLPII